MILVPSGRTDEVATDNREVVNCLHRGVGIVDRRRQSLAADVDLLPDAKRDVLFDGALEANPNISVNRLFKGLGIRARGPPPRAPRPSQ